MTDIQIKIDAIGIPKVKSDIRSVVDQFKQAMLSIQQAEERHVQRMSELKRKLQAVDNNVYASSINSHRNITQSIEREEERHQLRMKHMKERGALAQQEAQNKGINFNTIRHALQAAGFNRLGHAFGALSSITGGSGVNVGASIAGGAAIGGLMITVTALTAVFDVLKGAAEQTVGAFLGAAAQLGGWKGLQQTIVDSAEEQQAERRSMLSVPFNERLGQSKINSLANRLATTPGLGGFARGDIIDAINAVGTTSGRQKSFSNNDWDFIVKYAKRTGTKPEEVAKLFGSIGFQNKDFGGEDIQSAILGATGIGQSLSFSAGDLLGAPKVLGASQALGGGQKNIRTAMTLAGILKPQLGSLEQAGTAEAALFREMKKHAGELGINIDSKTGQFKDPIAAIAKFVGTPFSVLQNIAPGLVGRETEPAREALSNAAQGQAGKDLEEKTKNLIEKYNAQSVSIADFERENEQLTDSTEQLKIAVNKLSDWLKDDILPRALEHMATSAEGIANYIDQHKGDFELVLNDFIQTLAKIALFMKRSYDFSNSSSGTSDDNGLWDVITGKKTLWQSFTGEKVPPSEADKIKQKAMETLQQHLQDVADGKTSLFGPSSNSATGPGWEPKQVTDLAQEIADQRAGQSNATITNEDKVQAENIGKSFPDDSNQILKDIRDGIQSLDKKTKPQLLPIPYRNPDGP